MKSMTRLILIAAALPVMAFAKEPAAAAATGLKPTSHVVRPAGTPQPLVTRPAPAVPAIDPEREVWRHQGVG